MSAPADNTRGCPVCGRAWQARGCSPGACKSDPDGLCVVCTARKLQAEREGKVDFALCAACAAMMEEKRAAPPVRPAGEHSLPWHWEKRSPPPGLRDGDYGMELVDAAGNGVLWTDGDDTIGIVGVFDDPYVREVTALAPELEQLLRAERHVCREAALEKAGQGPVAVSCGHAEVDLCWEHKRRALIARLDAARKAGRGG